MIRDPSDGSVREGITPEANRINAVARKSRSEGISGLPTGSKKDKHIARLEWSRDWMKAYHTKKETQHARGSDIEQEHSTDGRSGNDQRGAKS